MNNINSVTISGTITATGEMSGSVQITGEPVLDSVTVKSTGVSQTIVPEQGVDGFNEITVSPLLLQSKTVAPAASAQTVTPDSGFDGLSAVTVEAGGGSGFVLDFSVSWQGVVESYMFQNQTALTGVTFKINNPNLEIGSNAFKGCTNITRLEIPVCKNIGANAFVNCKNHDVYLGSSTQYGPDVIPMASAYDIGEPASIHVQWDMLDKYKNDSVWGIWKNIMVGDYYVP